jgi:hypothetical protein
MRNQNISSSLNSGSSEPLLQKEKMEKYQRTLHQATRFNITSQAQDNPYLELGASLIAWEKEMKLPSVQNGFLFHSMPVMNSNSTSSSFSTNQPQTALKTNVDLPAEQMQLQNELTQACYDCEIDKVKALIKQKGADPAIPDKDGRQPMAAALWGLSFKIMDYLEEKVAYTPQDWLELSIYVQKTHGAVVPQTKKIITHNDWLEHYEGNYATWFYSYDQTAVRMIPKIHFNWNRTQHINRIERGNNDGVYVSISSKPTELIICVPNQSYVMRDQVNWLNSMCELMINRLRGKGLVISENNQLVFSPTMNLKL